MLSVIFPPEGLIPSISATEALPAAVFLAGKRRIAVVHIISTALDNRSVTTVGMLRSTGFWAAAGFLLAVCGLLAAEDSAPAGPPAAWVEVLAFDPEAEALRPVVDEAVRYRLTGLGLAVRLRETLPTRASRTGREPATAASLLENAGRAGADFALECRYSGSGSRLSLQLAWYEVSTRLMTAAVDRKGRVDLVLDTVILDALGELLDRVRPRIEERVAAYRPPNVPAHGGPAAGGPGAPIGLPGTPVPGPGSSAGALSPSGSTAGGVPAAVSGSLAPAGTLPGAGASSAAGPGPATGALPGVEAGLLPGAVPGAERPVQARRHEGARLLIAPSLAPFLAVGAASYYFTIGYQSLLQIDFLPAGAGARLGLGGLLGVTAFQAQGASESGLGFLVPLGLSLRYSLELGRRWGLLFHLGGGAALLVMGTDSLGELAKLLPYVRSGVGVELDLGRSMSIALEAAYDVYFESPYLIMGFAPGLGLSWRL
jgi:hypothetical protein